MVVKRNQRSYGNKHRDNPPKDPVKVPRPRKPLDDSDSGAKEIPKE